MANDDILYVGNIALSTSVDGVGLRNALYVSGCPIHCKGCHNMQLWELSSGKRMTVQDVFEQLNVDDFNISILGGEPLMQYESVLNLCKKFKKETNKTIWLWSGYSYDVIKRDYPEILNYIDVLVDGPFIEEKKDLSLAFRGSSNQHIIHLHR